MNDSSDESTCDRDPPVGVAFLTSQVGAHLARTFAAKLAPLALTPNHIGVMRFLLVQPSLSQRALSQRMQLLPSQLVPLLDELEGRGLVARSSDPADRRRNVLTLTEAGEAAMRAVELQTRVLEDEVFGALSPEERETLEAMMRRVVVAEGLLPGVHPNYRAETPTEPR